MSEISVEIGKKIRTFRKKKGMTLDDLSNLICKSKSTLSKYEKGEIAMDIETMYDIAAALQIHVEQLLVSRSERFNIIQSDNKPAFFDGVSQFYSYLFDGRNNKLIRCVFDVLSETEINQYKIMMYMNFKEYAYYQHCETTYWGYIEHYDAVTNIILTNQHNPMEKASCQILASYLEAEQKWGLWNGFSSRPMMPIATKMLFSRTVLKEDEELICDLKISKEDIRLMKLYNMFPVF